MYYTDLYPLSHMSHRVKVVKTFLFFSEIFGSTEIKKVNSADKGSMEVFIHSWEDNTVTLELGVTMSSLTFNLTFNEV